MRHAVGDTVDAVVRLHLEIRENVGVVRCQLGVDRLDVGAVDQAKRGVSRCRDDIPATTLHELHGLVGGAEHLDVDLAASGLLEGAHPVRRRIRAAVLGIAGPRKDVQCTLAVAHGSFVHRDIGHAARVTSTPATAGGEHEGRGTADGQHLQQTRILHLLLLLSVGPLRLVAVL